MARGAASEEGGANRPVLACFSGLRVNSPHRSLRDTGAASQISEDQRVARRIPASNYSIVGHPVCLKAGQIMPITMHHDGGNTYRLDISGVLSRAEFERC